MNSQQPLSFNAPDQLLAHMRDYYSNLDGAISIYIQQQHLSIACHKGCGICCYTKLDVKAHELLYLADYVRHNLIGRMRDRVMDDLKKSAETIAPLSTRDHFLGRYKCGFLQDNSCAIHPARPSMCRKFNSISFESCQMIFSEDGKAPPEGPRDIELDELATNLIQNAELTLKEAGYDDSVYEINQAALLTLNDLKCMDRWLSKEKMLPSDIEAKTFSPETQERILKRLQSRKKSGLTSF